PDTATAPPETEPYPAVAGASPGPEGFGTASGNRRKPYRAPALQAGTAEAAPGAAGPAYTDPAPSSWPAAAERRRPAAPQAQAPRKALAPAPAASPPGRPDTRRWPPAASSRPVVRPAGSCAGRTSPFDTTPGGLSPPPWPAAGGRTPWRCVPASAGTSRQTPAD